MPAGAINFMSFIIALLIIWVVSGDDKEKKNKSK
jgi:hypothetical protein